MKKNAVKYLKMRWMVIYGSFFVCMIFLLIGTYFKIEGMVHDYANRYNSDVLRRMVMEMDSEFKNVQKFIINMPFDDEFYNFASREEVSVNDFMNLYGIDKKILTYAEGTGIGNNYLIYMKNNGTVVNTQGYLSAESGFSKTLENSVMSLPELERLLQNNFYLEYLVIKDKASQENDKIYLFHSFPNGVILNT